MRSAARCSPESPGDFLLDLGRAAEAGLDDGDNHSAWAVHPCIRRILLRRALQQAKGQEAIGSHFFGGGVPAG
jgi:hypothetical protein